jgi:hypothetical protein
MQAATARLGWTRSRGAVEGSSNVEKKSGVAIVEELSTVDAAMFYDSNDSSRFDAARTAHRATAHKFWGAAHFVTWRAE